MVLVGTGSRGTGFWGKNIINKYSDLVEFVGLCDINPGRVEYAKSAMGVSCPTFTDFDKMMQEIKPDTVIVTTVDATHHEFIVKALGYGAEVITEKPMTTDEIKLASILEAEKKANKKITVGFNYRHNPHVTKIKELLVKEREMCIRDRTKDEYNFIKAGQGLVPAEQSTEKLNLFKFFHHKQTWAYITGKALIDPIFWFFLFWLPSYFASSFSLDLKKPSWELMIIYTATTIGSIGGGYLSSLLIKRGWATIKARKFVLMLFAFTELTVILTQYAHAAWFAVLLLSIAVAVHQAWATNIFTLASDLFPKEAVATVVGIGGMAGAVGGILFPLFVGKLLDLSLIHI